MRDEQTTEQTLKIELLSQWKLEAEFRNITFSHSQRQKYFNGVSCFVTRSVILSHS